MRSKKKRRITIANVDTSKSQLDMSSETQSAAPTQSVQTPSSPSAPSIDIEIPCALKLKLEDDCYFIKRKKKLVRLPRSPNVIDILREYINHVTLQDGAQPSPHSSVKIVKEVMDGLRVYFDFTLSSLLLYNMERDQHERVMREAAAVKESRRNEVTSKEQISSSVSGEKSSQKSENIPNEIKEKSETKQSIKSESTAEKSTDESKDDQSSGRVLRRRSKRQSVSALTSSVFSTIGADESSLNFSSDTRSSSKKGIKRRLPPTKAKEDESSLGQKSSATTNSSTSSCINPSEVYGVEHLLRLFVRLPSLLAKATFEEKRLSLLLHHLAEFLSYLATRINTLTSEDVYGDSAVV